MALNRSTSSGRLTRVITGIAGTGIFLVSAASAWLLLVFRGFVVSVRASYEPMPFFLQLPVFAAILFTIGLLALAGAYLTISSFKRPRPTG